MTGNVSSTQTLSRAYEIIAHNLANASTTGFKRRVTIVSDAPPAAPAEESQAPLASETRLDFSQGRLVRTDRPLDLALHGKGFLVLESPRGELYTRSGVLHTSPEGRLVDADGRAFVGQAGPITIPNTASALDVEIAQDGRVLIAGQPIGRLRVVEFKDPSRLEPAGHNAYRAPEGAEPQDAGRTTVHQGFQEASNVDVVTELVALIRVSRLYEANVKAMQAQGDRSQHILQVAMA
jgi:flagellar basal body rod protein FlgG